MGKILFLPGAKTTVRGLEAPLEPEKVLECWLGDEGETGWLQTA